MLEVKAPTRLSSISLLRSQAEALSHVTVPDSLSLAVSLLSLGLVRALHAIMSDIKRHALFRVIGQWRTGVLQHCNWVFIAAALCVQRVLKALWKVSTLI